MYHLKRNSGGATRDRTADLLRARQALSQLSYSPSILRRPWVPHHPYQRAFSQIGFYKLATFACANEPVYKIQ